MYHHPVGWPVNARKHRGKKQLNLTDMDGMNIGDDAKLRTDFRYHEIFAMCATVYTSNKNTDTLKLRDGLFIYLHPVKVCQGKGTAGD